MGIILWLSWRSCQTVCWESDLPHLLFQYGLWAKNSFYTFTWQDVKVKRRLTFPDAKVWSGSIAHGSRAKGLVSSWWCFLRKFWKLRWGLTGGSVCRSVFLGMSWLALPPPFSASCVPRGEQLCSATPLPTMKVWNHERNKPSLPKLLCQLFPHTLDAKVERLKFQHHTLPILCSYFVSFPVWYYVCCVLCTMISHALNRHPAHGQGSVAVSDQWPTKPKIVTICPSTESICSRVLRRKWTHPLERRKWWFLFKIPHTPWEFLP